MSGEEVLKLYDVPEFRTPALIVGWNEDASKLSRNTISYLIQGLGCREFGTVLPQYFFQMDGVAVEHDVAQFPESRFYGCDRHDLIIFQSNLPRMEWYRFLNVILDAARQLSVKEIYTIGAMVSASAHTTPRQLIAIVSSGKMREELAAYNVITDSNYETPPGQKPTMSSYLLWLARQRGMTAVNLWVPIPYYLVPADDPRAVKRLLSFFKSKLELSINFDAIDAEIAEQNRRISQLYHDAPDIEGLVRRLETGDGLDSTESEKLAQGILDYLIK